MFFEPLIDSGTELALQP